MEKWHLCMDVMTPSMFGNTLLNVMVVAIQYHQRTVTPQRAGSPGCIFFCPECPHITFAYRIDKAQSLVK